MASRPSARDAAVIGLAAAFVVLLATWLDSEVVLDGDVVNLAQAIEEFDVASHRPQPPGYLGYVAALRVLDAVADAPALRTVLWLCRASGALAVLLTAWAAWVCWRDGARARWAAWIAATNPLLLRYSLDGQSHAAEAASAAACLGLMLRLAGAPSLTGAAWLGVAAGVGGSLRPTLAVLVIPAGLYALRGTGIRGVLVAGLTGTATSLAWILPTLGASGGLAAFEEAHDALVGAYLAAVSPLSSERNWPAVLTSWATVAVGVTACALAALGRFVPGTAADGDRALDRIALLTLVPPIAFYLLLFCAETGYVLGLLPVLVLCGLRFVGHARSTVYGALLVAIQLAAFAAPVDLEQLRGVPTLAAIGRQHLQHRTWLSLLGQGVDDDVSQLVVSDRQLDAHRQLPFLMRRSEYLAVRLPGANPYWPHGEATLSRPGAPMNAPRPVLLTDGPPARIEVRRTYDWVVVDPVASVSFRESVRRQSSCARGGGEPAATRNGVLRLPASCFPDARLDVGPHAIAWGREQDRVVANAPSRTPPVE